MRQVYIYWSVKKMVENVINTSVVVGTTSTKIRPQLLTGQRTAITITNTSTGGQIITLAWGGAAIALAGAVIYPGGNWSESRDPSFDPSTESIWAVSSAAAGALGIHERVRTQGV